MKGIQGDIRELNTMAVLPPEIEATSCISDAGCWYLWELRQQREQQNPHFQPTLKSGGRGGQKGQIQDFGNGETYCKSR